MQETSFYPRYTIRGSSDVLSLSLLMSGALIFSFLKVGASMNTLLGVMFLTLFIIRFSHMYIRRIVFMPSYFLVEWYVWPSKKVEYSDVIDLGFFRVKTRKGDVSFAAMSNLAQLQAIFSKLIQQGKIDSNQFEEEVVIEELALQKSFLPSMVISIILVGAFLFYWFYHQSRFSIIGVYLVLIVIGIMVTLGVHWIYKKRTRIK